MKTILVTGGTSGIGRGVAMHYLKQGHKVIVVGSVKKKGEKLYNDVKQMGAQSRLTFIYADLSVVEENHRVIAEIKNSFTSLDAVIFCAINHQKEYVQTQDGFEYTFALAYLSRFILSYGLKNLLENAPNPVIMNVCGSGMRGEINWDDIQHKQYFEPQKVMTHGSRLNDLLGVGFAENDDIGKIHYIMYNPWTVKTDGMMAFFDKPSTKTVYKIIGKSVIKAVPPIAQLIDNPPTTKISAYRESKALKVELLSSDPKSAKKLYDITINELKNI